MKRLAVAIAFVSVAASACGDLLGVTGDDSPPNVVDDGGNNLADGTSGDGGVIPEDVVAPPGDAADSGPQTCHAWPLIFGPPTPIEFQPPLTEAARHPFVFHGGSRIIFETGLSSATVVVGSRSGPTGPFTLSAPPMTIPVTSMNERYPTSNPLATEFYYREYTSGPPMQLVFRATPVDTPVQFSNSSTMMRWPSLSDDGLLFIAMRAQADNTGRQIVQVTRSGLEQPFINDDFTSVLPDDRITDNTSYPAITPDALGLFLYTGSNTVFFARTSRTAVFSGAPTNISLKNPAGVTTQALHVRSISADGCTIYLTNYAMNGASAIYSALRTPPS